MPRAATRGKRPRDADLVERRCRCKVGRASKPCLYVVRRLDHPDGFCFTCRLNQKRNCYRH